MSDPAQAANPTVLLVGRGERMADALRAALARRGITMETATLENLAPSAYKSAPDLAVLVGDAAEDGGRGALGILARTPATAGIPVALVADSTHLGARLAAFRHGIVSVVPRTASADELATRLAELARDVPERSGEVAGALAAASVDELVELLAEELRSGILSIAAGSDGVSTQIVLSGDQSVSEVVSDLVAKLRPLVSRAEGKGLRYEFFETPAARLASLDLDIAPDVTTEVFRGRRILLIEQNAARSDILVQELRAVGAEVVVADGEANGFDRARLLDPEVAVLDGAAADGWALGALRALRRDPRLRWASLAVVEPAQLWHGEHPNVERLAHAVGPLVRPDLELASRARSEASFETRLDLVGPIRLLRALIATGLGLRLRLFHPSVSAEIDLAEGLVVGAVAARPQGRSNRAEGAAALATFCALSRGRVQVQRKDAPATTNVMAPLHDALASAEREQPLVPSSVRPSENAPSPAVVVPRAPGLPAEVASEPEAVVQKLEALLTELTVIVEKKVPSLRPRPRPTPEVAVTVPAEARGGRKRATPASLARFGEEEDDDEPPTGQYSIDALADLRARAASRPHEEASVVRSTLRAMPPPPRRESAPPRRHQSTLMGMPAVREEPELVEIPVSIPNEGAPAARGSAAPSQRIAAGWASAPESMGSVPATTMRLAPEPLPSTTMRLPDAAPGYVPGAPPTPRASVRPVPSVAPSAPRRRSSIGVWIGMGILVGAAIGGVVAYAPSVGDFGQARSRPARTRANPTQRETAAARTPVAPPARAAEPEPPAIEPTPSPSGEPIGPREGEPLEGREEDFTLERFAIEREIPAGSYRERVQLTEALINRANHLRTHGQPNDSEPLYKRVLGIEPENPRATAGLTRLYLERRDLTQSLAFAQRLVRIKPRYPANYVLLGDVLQAAGNRPAAVRAWSYALVLNPRWRRARDRLRIAPSEEEAAPLSP